MKRGFIALLMVVLLSTVSYADGADLNDLQEQQLTWIKDVTDQLQEYAETLDNFIPDFETFIMKEEFTIDKQDELKQIINSMKPDMVEPVAQRLDWISRFKEFPSQMRAKAAVLEESA